MDKNVLWDLSYGMYVVGSKDDRKVGCIVNTAVQITSDPMTILVSVNHDNYTNKIISKTNKFSLSILGEKTDISLIGTFGYKSSKDIDKYENFETFEIDDMPVLKDSCGVIICEVIDKLETSTHTAFLGKVIDMKKLNNDKPMTYKYYHEVLKGKSPEKAPTFIKEEIINEDKNNNAEKLEEKQTKTVWKCKVCGYEVEMDELPDDFVCPICKKDKSFFEKIEK